MPYDMERFSDLDFIDSGSFAAVYSATDEELKKTVAIKILKQELADDAYSRDHFVQEARRLIQLNGSGNHSALVQPLKFGEIQGQPFIVMPFAAGGTLAARISGPRTGELEESQRYLDLAHKLVDTLQQGLSVVHHKGFVHRDVKPSNILIFSTGMPILFDDDNAADMANPAILGVDERLAIGDFGLATNYHERSFSGSLPAGTPGYTAPETIAADPIWTPKADIYSASVCVLQVLTGKPLSEGWEERVRGLGYSKELVEQLKRGTNLRRSERHRSIDEWAAGLRQSLTFHESRRRSFILAGAALAATLAVLSLTFVAVASVGNSDVAQLSEITADTVVASPETSNNATSIAEKTTTEQSTTTVASNLLSNGDFESTISPWENFSVNDSDAGTHYTEDQASGAGSLLHRKIGPYEVDTYQKVNGLADGSYVLSAKVKASGGQEVARMYVLDHGVEREFTNFERTAGWVEFQLEFEVTTGSATVGFWSKSSGGHSMLIDEVVLAPV